jgi:hypothetical protein
MDERSLNWASALAGSPRNPIRTVTPADGVASRQIVLMDEWVDLMNDATVVYPSCTPIFDNRTEIGCVGRRGGQTVAAGSVALNGVSRGVGDRSDR